MLVAKPLPGYAPVESPDCKFIYLTGNGTNASNLGLWRFPVEGGEPKQVLESLVGFRAYTLVDDGIYFIPRPDSAGGYSIQFLETATGRIRRVVELGKQRGINRLTLSPDRRWALYSQAGELASDLMLVENFR